jgi:hypothetical protein
MPRLTLETSGPCREVPCARFTSCLLNTRRRETSCLLFRPLRLLRQKLERSESGKLDGFRELLSACESHCDCRRQRKSSDRALRETLIECPIQPGTQNNFGAVAEYRGRSANEVCQNRHALRRSPEQSSGGAPSAFPVLAPETSLEAQSARSASRLPLYFLIVPFLRSCAIFRFIRFTNRLSSFSVTAYSRSA